MDNNFMMPDPISFSQGNLCISYFFVFDQRLAAALLAMA
jgi:hypothetical protein